MENIRVIYIIGAGRSGSTVRDTALCGSADVESSGKLINAPRAFVVAEEYCACGERVEDFSFWRAIQQEWVNVPEFDDFHELDRFKRRHELKRKLLSYSLISRLLKIKKYRRYLEGEQAMCQAIAHVSGKQVIADSSKNPIRVFALPIPGMDYRTLHLIRDGRGVAWPLSKPYKEDAQAGVQNELKSKPIWTSALSWIIMNLLDELFVVRVFRKRFMRIHCEDFMEDHAAAPKNIDDYTGVNYHHTIEKLKNGEAISVGHTVAGNRARMAEIIRLKPDSSWQESLSKKDKSAYWAICGWLAKRYGYQRII